MPVSPADFEFYSRMTGQPIPNTPAGRMAIAPQVYSMRRSPLSKVGDFISGVGQTAALLGGAAAGGLLLSQLAGKRGGGAQAEDIPAGAQGFKTDSDEELIGEPLTPEKRKTADELIQRYSGQTIVPQADVNVANESRAAQIASANAPTEPRVEVRQQPSSGVVVTDLSNNTSTSGGLPPKAAPGVESAVAEAQEFYEGSPGQSPFQAGGAMGELARQSRDVKALKQRVTDLDLPRSIRDDVAVFLTGAAGGQSAPQPFTQKEANTRIVGLIKEGIEQLEGGQPTIQFPTGQGSKYESMTLDPSGDINVKFRKGDKTYSYPQTPEGSEGFSQLAEMYNKLGPAKTAGESPYVTNKGKEVEGVMNQVASQKRQRRESELRDVMRKGGARLSPEEQEQAVQKMLTDEGF